MARLNWRAVFCPWQAITGIRTITAFNMQQQMLDLYSAELVTPLKMGLRDAHTRGVSAGMAMFISMGSYGLLFW